MDQENIISASGESPVAEASSSEPPMLPQGSDPLTNDMNSSPPPPETLRILPKVMETIDSSTDENEREEEYVLPTQPLRVAEVQYPSEEEKALFLNHLTYAKTDPSSVPAPKLPSAEENQNTNATVLAERTGKQGKQQKMELPSLFDDSRRSPGQEQPEEKQQNNVTVDASSPGNQSPITDVTQQIRKSTPMSTAAHNKTNEALQNTEVPSPMDLDDSQPAEITQTIKESTLEKNQGVGGAPTGHALSLPTVARLCPPSLGDTKPAPATDTQMLNESLADSNQDGVGASTDKRPVNPPFDRLSPTSQEDTKPAPAADTLILNKSSLAENIQDAKVAPTDGHHINSAVARLSPTTQEDAEPAPTTDTPSMLDKSLAAGENVQEGEGAFTDQHPAHSPAFRLSPTPVQEDTNPAPAADTQMLDESIAAGENARDGEGDSTDEQSAPVHEDTKPAPTVNTQMLNESSSLENLQDGEGASTDKDPVISTVARLSPTTREDAKAPPAADTQMLNESAAAENVQDGEGASTGHPINSPAVRLSPATMHQEDTNPAPIADTQSLNESSLAETIHDGEVVSTDGQPVNSVVALLSPTTTQEDTKSAATTDTQMLDASSAENVQDGEGAPIGHPAISPPVARLGLTSQEGTTPAPTTDAQIFDENMQDDEGPPSGHPFNSPVATCLSPTPVQDDRKPAPTTNHSGTPQTKTMYSNKRKIKGVPWVPLPFYGQRIRELTHDKEVASNVPNGASSIVHIMGRRINLAQHVDIDPDFYVLARDWVEDNPHWTQKRRRWCNPISARPHPEMVEIVEKGGTSQESTVVMDSSQPTIDAARHDQQPVDIISVVKGSQTGDTHPSSMHDKDRKEGKESKSARSDSDKVPDLLQDLISRGKETRAQALKKFKADDEATLLSLLRKGIILPPKKIAKLSR